MTKKIFKRYVDQNNFKEINEDDVVEYCENRGYWKEGTSLKTLYECGKITTPHAEYIIKEIS